MTQPIERYVRVADPLARLRDHAARLTGLQRVLEGLLPAALAESCGVANLKGDTLILHAEGGAAAAKLKQLAPSLQSAFAAKGVLLADIRVKVRMPDPQPHRPAPPPRDLPRAACDDFVRLAGKLPAESPLALALQRFVHKSRRPG